MDSITYPLNPNDFQYLRIRQYLYYNQLTKEFYLYPVSAGIIQNKYDDDGNLTDYEILAWFPIHNNNEKPDLKEDRIHWALHSFTYYSIENNKQLKENTGKGTILKEMMEAVRDTNINIYHFEFNDDGREVIKMKDKEQENLAIIWDDTYNYDPKTKKEVPSYQKLEPNYEKNLNHLFFIQLWNWDGTTGKLSTYNEAMSPVLLENKYANGRLYAIDFNHLYLRYYKSIND